MGGFLDDHKWKLDGACRGERAEVFFEERYEAVALSFCARCPVVDPCFHAGIREQYGVWGGLVRGWLSEDDDDFSD
ncbi:MAG: WhiB family transcriptional regulator [Arenicellales bacterium]|jgi:hypothetical protein|nr:WhiB family transcriptional regulator [Arenicellales bacterium]|tara:strand:+ start:143 stop:370 length:228 start_codon:yes stop_codon:yes gene_type:complete